MSIRAFASRPFITLRFVAATAPNSDTFWDFSTYLLSQYPALAELGMAGYGSYIPDSSIDGIAKGIFSGSFFNPGSESNTSSSLAAALEPIYQHVNATWPGQFQITETAKTYPQFNDYFQTSSGPNDAGGDITIGSRLLDAKALSGDLAALKKALKASSPTGMLAVLVSGKGVRDAIPRGGSNAVNPAWRKSLVHASSSIPHLFKCLYLYLNSGWGGMGEF